MSGKRAAHFLQSVLTCDAAAMKPGSVKRTFMLDGRGGPFCCLFLFRLEPDESGFDHFLLSLNTLDAHNVLSWLRGLSDGYVTIDAKDRYRKVEGPVVINKTVRKWAERSDNTISQKGESQRHFIFLVSRSDIVHFIIGKEIYDFF